MSSDPVDIAWFHQNGFIENLKGKEYLKVSGLVVLSHQQGITSVETEMMWADHTSGSFIVRAVADGKRGRFTGLGDAGPKNLKQNMRPSALRMAETRAIARALRMYLGIGMTILEELPGEDPPSRARESGNHTTKLQRALDKAGVGMSELATFQNARGEARPATWDAEKVNAFIAWLESGGDAVLRNRMADGAPRPSGS